MARAGKIAWPLVPEYVAGEIIGAMLGATLVWVFYRDHFKITEDESGR